MNVVSNTLEYWQYKAVICLSIVLKQYNNYWCQWEYKMATLSVNYGILSILIYSVTNTYIVFINLHTVRVCNLLHHTSLFLI